MHARPASPDDLPAITALQAGFDTHWFGAPESDESEIQHVLELAVPLDERSRVLLSDDGHLLAASWWWSADDVFLAVRHDAAPEVLDEVYDDLLGWFAACGVHDVEALAGDTARASALERHGWEHWLSSFELIREVTPDWQLPEPVWPEGVTVTDLTPDAERATHELIYDRARWATIPGHGTRGFDEWRHIFVADEPADQQVLAWRGDELVGAALGKIFSDGSGWVAQLAVPQELQKQGIGRALLLEAFRRRVAGGAQRLGLGVSAENAHALGLYLGIGLQVDREWRKYRPSAAAAATSERASAAAGTAGS
ncbi:MAG: GNAT family N-acetyltransferase [Angustibacter sp.]